jgi:hypothetical protein
MLRDKVAAWLAGKDDVTDVKPVIVRINGKRWQGAFYQQGEPQFYLVGERPVIRHPSCFKLLFPEDTTHEIHDWYIGGHIEWKEDEPLADWETHPFGNHWLLVPWLIDGQPGSKIDDHADETYTRQHVDVEIF